MLIYTIFITPSFAQKLTGQISKDWDVNKARTEALNNVPKIDLSKYSPVDPFHADVMKAKANKVSKISNCEIEFFDDNTYAIRQNGSPEGLYYEPNGNLKAIHLDSGDKYPKKTYKYLYPQGIFLGVSISPEKGDNYVFFYDGEFIIHWIGDNGYDEKGKLIETRKAVKEEDY